MKAMINKHPVALFFILALLISWVLWIPLLYGRFALGWSSWEGNSWSNPRTMLGLLGSMGPALAAVIVSFSLNGKQGVCDLIKKMAIWKVGWKWWLLAMYAWWLIATLLAGTLGLVPTEKAGLQFVIALINIPAMIFLLQMPLLIGMVGEELGWRGFALPRLLNKQGPILASLVIALPWIVWHAPLMVFQDWMGNTPLLQFLLKYTLLIIPLSLIFTWVFKNTQGSVLLVILFHKAFNLTFNAFHIALGLSETDAKLIYNGMIIILWIWAAILSIKYLRNKEDHQQPNENLP